MAALSYSIISIVSALIVYNFVAGRQWYRQHKYRKSKGQSNKIITKIINLPNYSVAINLGGRNKLSDVFQLQC